MNLRQKLQVVLMLILTLFAFASYHEGTGSTAWLRPHGQMTVKSTNKRAVQKDSQTVRVRNSRGQTVCLLHIMGMHTATPGSCIHLEWDFTTKDTTSDAAADDTVPCHQVAACVQGEERAMRENGSSVRTQSILLDTCHEWVEPGVTDTISKTLHIDSSHDNNNGGSLESTPCQVQTDIVSISMWLQVDMTVDAQNGIDYDTLSLQLPLHIRHKLVDEEDLLLEQEEHVIPLTELLGVEDDATFPVRDIRADLKNLARLMDGHLQVFENDDDDEDSANDDRE